MDTYLDQELSKDQIFRSTGKNEINNKKEQTSKERESIQSSR